ncbi:ABC-type organic anion transporter ABCA8-like isoform X2 [Rhea pennata]|uniref:ABC-type organic anion transporter ABCA8-like isoform X2 n=1 Tax=Rhea pennata TaxID=8795 RepID=UPI002E25A5C7
MPPEFNGKEAIRLNNIKKTYKKKDKRTEALRDLSLKVYEGQITALLGHSGSGKTTLLNVLSGFAQPSAGSAMIYNYKVSEIDDMEGIQAIVGICPQINLHFEALTVKENLRTFAHIKGIHKKEVEQEVQKVLAALDLTNHQDVRANTLSEGQKRKLSLGIAILGNPKVLLLDEPTVGLDPSSRQRVWRLLKEHQANRVTLFATQFMDEADIHADRKAFLSNGRLQCVGSSLYLKRKWGVGYDLRMHVNDLCDPDVMSSLVRQYIPDAVFRGRKGDELCYMLPAENMDAFPDLFGHLDSNLLQGVVNYEVSRATLEDVFLKLEGEEAVVQEEDSGFSNEHAEDGECFNFEEMDQSLLTLWERGRAVVSGMELWRQQVRAMARVRFLKLKHEGRLFRSLLLFFGVFIFPMIIIVIGIQLFDSFNNWELTAGLYFLPTEERTHIKSTNLLIFNDTGSEIEDFIHALKIQNIVPEIAIEENITSMPLYNGAIKISLEGKHYQYTIMCSTEPINCYPVLMNILSNTFLRLFNSTARIRIWSNPFNNLQNPATVREIFYICLIYMLILTVGLPSHFAVSSMDDYKIKARTQLRLAGLVPSAYWCGQALVDVSLFWALISLMFGILILFCHANILNATVIISLIFCIIGYGASLVLLIYLIAFRFRKGRSNRYIWSFILILITLIFFFFNDQEETTFLIFSALIPVFPLLGWFIFSVSAISHPEIWSNIFVVAFAPYVHCVIFAFFLRCLETRYGGAVMRSDPIFRIHRGKPVACQNRDHPGEEAAEVQAERERVRSMIASLPQEEDPVIIVNSVRKEYEDKKASSFLKKKKKVAVKNLSFSVKKGEVLGLLGPNGAGKSTTISMISGDITLTAGEVLIKGSDAAASSPGQDSPGLLGYCPQENSLWPDLTVQEHLETYAAVKGMRKEDAAVNISRIAEAMDLQKRLKTAVRRLSVGEARKLCFALSVLGDPTVMLWDEPSAGMDLKEQHCMWRTIQSALRSKERGAVLSTRCLDKAMATCDRVAILVSGQLRSSSLLVYKIPVENVLPLSQSFSKLEAAKQNSRLEEYSLSLRTLQQVFIDLIKDPEEHDQDAASTGAQDWRSLHPRAL